MNGRNEDAAVSGAIVRRPVASLWRRRVRTSLLIGACASLALALVAQLRASSVEYMRRPVRDADVAVAPTRISGSLRDPPHGGDYFGSRSERLPAYRLHWDGQPPKAVLVDARTDQVLGVSALSEETLKLNQNAVLWTPTVCKFVMNPSLYAASRPHLAIKFEVPGPRQAFYVAFVVGLALFFLTVIAQFGNRLLFVRTDGRLEGVFGYVQTIAFFLVATLVLTMLFPGYPVNGPLNANTGDESNINSFAAALDHPEVFQRDKFLSEPANFAWYTPLYVQAVRLFQLIGFRYDTHRAFVIFVSTLIGLFGYQRLFGTLSGSAWFGCVAAICIWFLQTSYPPNEGWSAVFASPRTAYAALLPWAVLYAGSVLDRPTRWWLPSAATGLLFYVHPVSSPALAGAVLVGFLAAGRERLRERCLRVLIAAAAAVAVMVPYIVVYAGKYGQTITPDTQTAAKALQYAAQRFAPGYTDLSVFYSQLADLLTQKRRYWLGAAAILLLIPVCRRSVRVRFFYGALAGLCVVTFVIPFVDLTLAKRLQRLPFQVDLIRNIRYLDVIVLCAVALVVGEYRGLWERQAAHPRDAGRRPLRLMRTVAIHGLAVIGILVVLYCYRDRLHPGVRPMIGGSRATLGALQGRHQRLAVSTMEVVNALHALRRGDETVYGPLNLRQAYIPLAFLFKDLGALSYANPERLVEARETIDRAKPYLMPPVSASAATQAAHIMDAQILVLSPYTVEPSLLESSSVIFRNSDYVVLRIEEGRAGQGGGTCEGTISAASWRLRDAGVTKLGHDRRHVVRLRRDVEHVGQRAQRPQRRDLRGQIGGAGRASVFDRQYN